MIGYTTLFKYFRYFTRFKSLPSSTRRAFFDAERLLTHTAQALQPTCPDVLFTVGLLIISAVFPSRTQALGGAVFNTCSQLGTSIGLTVTSVISDSTIAKSGYADHKVPEALLVGYRAVFWALFAWTLLVCVTDVWGLRRVGKIGMKEE